MSTDTAALLLTLAYGDHIGNIHRNSADPAITKVQDLPEWKTLLEVIKSNEGEEE